MTTEGPGEPRASGRLRPPGLGLLLAEARGILELNASLLLSPLLLRAPRGDGHPVLTLPGFLATDLSMVPMRHYLSELGYVAHAWRMGRNTGSVSRTRIALRDRLREIFEESGRKVSLVGWSLGGVYARDLALRAPEMVRYVVTLASPFANDVTATNATRLYEALSGERVDPEFGIVQGGRRRPAGADQRDLFEGRRRRELAYRPPASLRPSREHRNPSCKPCRARRQSGGAVGGRGPPIAGGRPVPAI